MADNHKHHFGIRDNHSRGNVTDFLTKKITAHSRLSVVSAYFTIYAYEALSKELDQIEHLSFLFGEPSFIASLDPEKTDKKSFKIEDEGLNLANRLQQKEVARRCVEWIRNKVEIRSVRQANLLHGKLYHIDDGRREHALLGSSNFTRRGLGLSATSNIELNLIVDSDRDRADLKQWFDDIWNDDKLVADVKNEVLRYLEQLYVNHAPEFIYFKTLYHVFERFISGQEADAALFDQTAIVDTEIWKALFDFQKDGVKGAIHKINTHNGCILADSVGLGKTYSALAVIKYYELRNHRVLVLCPKKLRENWTVYLAQNNSELNPFLKDRFAYAVLSHTDLSRESGKVDGVDLATLNWGNFDLIIIDEALNEIIQKTPWRSTRGVLFLDPYGMTVRWDTLQKVAATKALDVWYLFPLSAVYRQAAIDFNKVDEGKAAALDSVLGTTEWRTAFYSESQQESLLDVGKSGARRTAGPAEITSFVHARLCEIFKGWVSSPILLPERGGPPMFALFFAVSNPAEPAVKLSKKAADHLFDMLKNQRIGKTSSGVALPSQGDFF